MGFNSYVQGFAFREVKVGLDFHSEQWGPGECDEGGFWYTGLYQPLSICWNVILQLY